MPAEVAKSILPTLTLFCPGRGRARLRDGTGADVAEVDEAYLFARFTAGNRLAGGASAINTSNGDH